jgi:hypothetical protein
MSGTLVLAAIFDQGFLRGLLKIAVAFCWGFALFDLVRRPLSGWKKAVWLVVILVVPILGAVVYLLAQPLAASPTREALAQRGADEALGVNPPRGI